MRSLLLATSAIIALSGSANAANVVLDFDAITTGAVVDNFYLGLGVSTTGLLTTSGFGETSAPNLAYNTNDPATFDTSFGFSGLSFTAGFFSSGTISVYSGSNGTGSLVGSASGVLGNPYAFAFNTVALSGKGRSIVISGNPGQLGFDDVTFAVPEPATWAMMIIGFGAAGSMIRRNKPVIA